MSVSASSSKQTDDHTAQDPTQEEEGSTALVLVEPEQSTAQEQASVEQTISISRYNYVDISTIPTLFPAPIAGLITALATSARVSLRLSAFFIEAILETSQYSTRLSLGYTRRLLVTALSSARRVYLISNAAADGEFLSLIGYQGQDAKEGEEEPRPKKDGFLQVLDKYTNLGIYIIHHTFTLAELFAMSGFYLTANAVQSAHFAAQESVALFDGLFGSNESSRALSAIISMVRRELLEDERFKAKDKGTIKSLTALTKALTAFACLQNATWKKTATKFKMKMLYDCTVLKEKEELVPFQSTSPTPPNATAGPGPSTQALKAAREEAMQEVDGRLWAHINDPDALPARFARPSPYVENEMALDDLLSDSSDAQCGIAPAASRSRDKQGKRRTHDFYEITEEYRESTETTQMFEQRRSERSPDAHKSSHRRLRSAPMLLKPEEGVDDNPLDPLSLSRIASGSAGDEDWIEIDNAMDQDISSIPSLPNGLSTRGDSMVRNAIERTKPTSDRVQLVLRTMTNKLLSRKRIVRRIPSDDSTISGRETGAKRSSPSELDAKTMPWNRNRGMSPLKVAPSAASSTMAATPTIIAPRDSKGRSSKHKQRSVSPDPTSTDSQISAPVAKTINRHRLALKPLSKRTRPARSPSPAPFPSFDEADDGGSGNLVVPKVPPPSPVATTRSLEPMTPLRAPPNTIRDPRKTHRRLPSLSTVHDSIEHSSQSRYQAASAENMPTSGTDTPEKLFPHDSLLNNIHRFMRCSSAAYGQNFLRIFGMGTTEFNFPSTGKHHANTWSFAQHTNLPIESIILSSYAESSPTFGTQKAPPLVHYLAVDHKLGVIILTCRGTLGLSDVLIDLTCEYCEVKLDGADPQKEYYAHSGMYRSALSLTSKRSTVHEALSRALEQNPAYGLVVTGHSLGGGVAGLLSIACSMPAKSFIEQNALKPSPIQHPPISTPFVTSFSSGLPPGRPIHCYTYGVPAIASSDLAEYSKGLISSVIHNEDVVPCLSLGVLRDLKNVALTLFEEGNVAEEIVGRVMGVYQRKIKLQSDDGDIRMEAGMTQEEMNSDWMTSLINTMRADMESDKLYPPGDVYIMEYHDVFVTIEGNGDAMRDGEKTISHKQAHRATLHKCDSVKERFREPVFSKTMLNDHLPMHYERATQLLMEGAAKGATAAGQQTQQTSRM